MSNNEKPTIVEIPANVSLGTSIAWMTILSIMGLALAFWALSVNQILGFFLIFFVIIGDAVGGPDISRVDSLIKEARKKQK